MEKLMARMVSILLERLQQGIEIDIAHCRKRIEERVDAKHEAEIIRSFQDTVAWVKQTKPKGDWSRFSKPTGYKIVGCGCVIKSVLGSQMVPHRINW
jgi:hypothetical protein